MAHRRDGSLMCLLFITFLMSASHMPASDLGMGDLVVKKKKKKGSALRTLLEEEAGGIHKWTTKIWLN